MESQIPSEKISQYTKQIASVIFNKGSEYITQVLGNKQTQQSFRLEDIIKANENENDFLQNLNTSTKQGDGETIDFNNQKLWISWYYQIAILDSICKNIQSFSTTLIDQKKSFLENPGMMNAIENISSSTDPSPTSRDHTYLYREILDVNITGTENSYSTYSYKLYIKALINYAISISVKEPIPVSRIKEYITQYSPKKKNYILPIIEISYKKLVESDEFSNYIKIIEESIVEGLKTSDMFTETPSTVASGRITHTAQVEPEGEAEEALVEDEEAEVADAEEAEVVDAEEAEEEESEEAEEEAEAAKAAAEAEAAKERLAAEEEAR
jgi:hypothetical protein